MSERTDDDRRLDSGLGEGPYVPSGDDRVPYGRYRELQPILHRLVVHYGVSTRVAAEVFGLRHKSLSARLGESGAYEERELRDREVAQQALAELILDGHLPGAEYLPKLTPDWREEVRILLQERKGRADDAGGA